MSTRGRLAIVDDDPSFRQYLQILLQERGYDVQTYAGGAQLLEAFSRGASHDIVLLDVQMPGLSGLETLRAAREAMPGTRVVMLSGHQMPSAIVESIRAGALDYVVKPDDAEGVGEAALEQMIEANLESAREDQATRDDVDAGDVGSADSPMSWRRNPAMRQVLGTIDKVADSDVSVLITGESGAGKEVVARELHKRSARRARPFVKVNCAALPAELLESELFGHERGAFTGANTHRIGKFEHASGGTIFLDEIGEMPLQLQPKLLHVLQDGTVTKLGNNRPVRVDTRIIAATNRSMAEMIAARQFREDLYYRLQVIEIWVPPLRERRDEILPLAEQFLTTYSRQYTRKVAPFSPRLRELLAHYDWPGNVRELENVVKRHVILQDEALLEAALKVSAAVVPAAEATPALHQTVSSVPAAPAARTDDGANLTALSREASMTAERTAIEQALSSTRWNRRQAARTLGVSYKTLLNKMKACGLTTPAPPAEGFGA
ncbi:MAG: sigma-54 dependent transcriptional regulator [Acidobacteriota bacterium]